MSRLVVGIIRTIEKKRKSCLRFVSLLLFMIHDDGCKVS